MDVFEQVSIASIFLRCLQIIMIVMNGLMAQEGVLMGRMRDNDNETTADGYEMLIF